MAPQSELPIDANANPPHSLSLDDDAPHILLIDDDRRIRQLLSRYLLEHGYRVTTAESAFVAEARMQGLAFDLLILDVMMPGRSGFEFAAMLREDSEVPILMLTAQAETEHRVEGLQLGVDDYLAKPFDPRELLLRIANILRRTSRVGEPRRADIARFGDITFNLGNGELHRGGKAIRLTERERDLLRVLAANVGSTVSRADLAKAGITGSERAVDVQVNRLRRKIETDPANPVVLQTVRGVGYRLHDS
jgi:two-component system, OmpR family, phosphate regulon response regulator OmpR